MSSAPVSYFCDSKMALLNNLKKRYVEKKIYVSIYKLIENKINIEIAIEYLKNSRLKIELFSTAHKNVTSLCAHTHLFVLSFARFAHLLAENI